MMEVMASHSSAPVVVVVAVDVTVVTVDEQ